MSVSEDVTSTLRAEDHGHPPVVLIYDARGHGGGDICPTITGDHQNRITDYTAIAVFRSHKAASGSMSPALERSEHLEGIMEEGQKRLS